MPAYPDAAALDAVLAELKTFPPLVSAGEARELKARLAGAVTGEAFLLQGGDCAESFGEFNTADVMRTFQTIMQMAIVLTYAGEKPVVKVGRIAGQFAKPRSEPTETIDGVTLPSYLGDNINDLDFTPQSRTPDPQRLIKAYSQSASTLNFIRALANGGHADLHRVRQWMSAFVEQSPQGKRYADVAEGIRKTLAFIEACGMTPETTPQVKHVDVYTSHEALLLPFEQSMTREDSTHPGDYVDTSAHFLWIGDRTRQADGAHVEFLRGVINPIGLKCGPSLDPDDLLRLIDILNPENEPGRLTLIARFGKDKVEAGLPKLVAPVVRAGKKVVWSCDPMHGNTLKAPSGRKTRPFDDILSELHAFMNILPALGATPGGVHVEMTGKNVTECLGGAEKVTDAMLTSEYYHTRCDPRLNGKQALELAFEIADALRSPSAARTAAAE